jgi:hypothetical protein
MYIRMAVNTRRESNLESRLRPRRDVALLAGNAIVRLDERKVCVCMICDRECRRLPPCHGVTGFAFAVIGARCKLATVGIGSMAIGACRVRDRRPEVSLGMTGKALDFKMFSEEREVRSRVIECCLER